jgi:hypothetical protein
VHQPERPGQGIAVDYGNTEQALANAGLLNFYPNSLLVFEIPAAVEGSDAPRAKVIERIGQLPPFAIFHSRPRGDGRTILDCRSQVLGERELSGAASDAGPATRSSALHLRRGSGVTYGAGTRSCRSPALSGSGEPGHVFLEVLRGEPTRARKKLPHAHQGANRQRPDKNLFSPMTLNPWTAHFQGAFSSRTDTSSNFPIALGHEGAAGSSPEISTDRPSRLRGEQTMLMRPRTRYLTLALLFVAAGGLFFGARWWMLRELEHRFGPVGASIEEKRHAALAAASEGLRQVPESAILLSSPLDTLLPALDAVGLDDLSLGDGWVLQLSEPRIAGDRQALNVQCAFRLTQSGQGLVAEGEMTAVAPVSAAPKSGGLEVRIAPELTDWTLRKLELGRWQVGPGILGALDSALDKARKEINARLGPIVLPVDLRTGAQTIAVPVPQAPGSTFEVSTPALAIASITVLLDQNSLYALVGILPRGQEAVPQAPAATTGLKFEAVRNDFFEKTRQVFGAPPAVFDGPRVRASRGLLALLSASLPRGVTAQERVRESVAANSSTLAGLDDQVVGLTLSAERLNGELVAGLAAAASAIEAATGGTLENPRVEIADQALRLFAEIRNVEVGDRVKASGRFSGLVTPFPSTAGLRLAPAFDTLELESLELSGWTVDPVELLLDLSLAETGILPVANTLLPPIAIELPRVESKVVPLVPPNAGPRVTYAPAELTTPALDFGTAVTLLDARGLRVLVGVQSAALNTPGPRPSAVVPGDPTFDQYRAAFEAHWQAAFGDDTQAGSSGSVLLAKRLAARFLDGAWPHGGIKAKFDFNETTDLEDTNHRLGHIDTSFNCRRTRQCDRDPCNRRSCNRGPCSRRSCPRPNCDRDCLKCVNLGPLGRACAEDPTCQAAEVTCNLAADAGVLACNTQAEAEVFACNAREEAGVLECNAREELAVAECNIREELKVADCNRLAEMEVLACNVQREAAQGLSNLGDIGSTSGKIQAVGSGQAHLERLEVASDLGSARLVGSAGASGSVRAEVDFLPKGGVGHIVGCVAPIRFRPEVGMTMSSQVDQALTVALVESEGKLIARLAVPPIHASGQMSPAPLDALFISNPEMTVVCPILSQISNLASLLGKGLTLITGREVAETTADDTDLERFLKESRGYLLQFGAGVAHVKLEAQTLEVSVPELKIRLPSGEVVLVPKIGTTTIGYELPAAAPTGRSAG